MGMTSRASAGRDHLLGDTSGFRARTAGYRPVYSGIKVGIGPFGRKQHQPMPLSAAPLFEFRPGVVAGDGHLIEVVHARPAEVTVRYRKARRLDNVGRYVRGRRTGAESFPCSAECRVDTRRRAFESVLPEGAPGGMSDVDDPDVSAFDKSSECDTGSAIRAGSAVGRPLRFGCPNAAGRRQVQRCQRSPVQPGRPLPGLSRAVYSMILRRSSPARGVNRSVMARAA